MQSFVDGASFQVAAENATNSLTFDLTTGKTRGARSDEQALSISFNAATGVYNLSAGSRTARFIPADLVGQVNGERRFFTQDGSTSEILTLIDEPLGGGPASRYVRLGYWQSNQRSGIDQVTQLDMFAFGFPTSISAVPVTGAGTFRTEVIGLRTVEGGDPVAFNGISDMVIDFGRSTFGMEGFVAETFFTTGEFITGGLYFNTGGLIDSATGRMNGTFMYRSPGGQLFGTLEGGFFGPSAEEAGGTLLADMGNGSTINGAWAGIGRRGPDDLGTVAGLSTSTSLGGFSSRLFSRLPDVPSGNLQQVAYDESRFIIIDPQQGTYRLSNSGESFDQANRVTSSDNRFEVYEKQVGDFSYRLRVYQGNDGQQVPLSYSSFATYQMGFRDGNTNFDNRDHFVFGLLTPEGVLDGRTGSATYRGFTTGTAVRLDGSHQLSLAGGAQFDIEFGSEAFSGWISLLGTREGGAGVDFGRYTLRPGSGFDRDIATALRDPAGAEQGMINLRFYGPFGQELGGAFSLAHPDYVIAGVALTGVD